MEHISHLAKLSDLDILIALAAGEASSEPFLGKVAVCFVALNRQRLAKYGITKQWQPVLSSVVLQKHQFSCFWSDWNKRKNDIELAITRHWSMYDCVRAAQLALLRGISDPTLGADHYHADYIKQPSWAKSMVRTTKIGRHIFYAAYRV